MPQIDFYHLTQSDIETALVMLVQKSLLAGKRVLVQCPRPAAEAIDDALWVADRDSWIPHGLDDAPGRDKAPVWICSASNDKDSNDKHGAETDGVNPDDATFLFLLHGAQRDDMPRFERVFNIFDGRSEAQVGQARDQWQSWRDMDAAEMRYFAQDDAGKWEQRA